MSKYYIYLHRRLSDNRVFYVGKGSSRRAWSTQGRSPYWFRVKEKHGLVVELVFENLEEQESYELERETIKEMLYFNEPLTNLNDGGVGGLNPSEETRLKQSLAKKGTIPHNKGKPSLKTKGVLNPAADKSVYEFLHENGETFTGTRYEIADKFSLDLKTFGKLFYKKDRKNKIYGWKVLRRLECQI